MDLTSQRWHFIGIGGAGMSALAIALLDLGATVSGSDLDESDATRQLQQRGARVAIGHNAANLGGATWVVLTGAVPPDNPELMEAQRLELPIIKRAVLLGMLMDTRRGAAIAGTHGKTTTSAMIAWVLAKTGRDPSYMVGGSIRGLGPGGHWGGGAVLVAEADEYDSSFLQLRPEVAIITNIEPDHLDYYGTMEAIFAAFGEFAMNVQPGGLLVVCADSPHAASLAAQLLSSAAPFRLQLYGTSPDALWRPLLLKGGGASGGISYIALRDEKEVARVSLRVPGMHNALNSLAALAVCIELGVEPSEAAYWLGRYSGAARRFEQKGTAWGVTVVDDYAHHPTELAATLAAARQRFPGRRLVAVFQPHTYTRTRDFLDGFAAVLGAADWVIVTEIYASRERDTLGLSGRMLAERVTRAHAEFARTLRDAGQAILDDIQPGDVLLTMGAGDVWKVGEEVLGELHEREEAGETNHVVRGARHIPSAKSGDFDTTPLSEQVQAPRASIAFASGVATRLHEETGLAVMRDEPMSKHDSLRIGGPASLYVDVATVEDLVAVVLFARREGLPYIVVGNGTNILVGDYGINGLVIHNRTKSHSHEAMDDDTSIWHVDSGLLFSILARVTCDAGWTGQEWANSVPGSVGGGVVSNAGAHGKELKDDLVSIEVLTVSGEIETWPVEALEMGYRTSRFKAQGRRDLLSPQEVVLRAHIRLYRDKEGGCEARLRGFLKERKAKQPAGKSAGSTFKNPPDNSAGYLIEQVGLKGHRHGQAQFSPKHANFMMNLGGATAAEVRHLMDLAREKVREQFGIELEPEIEFVGDE
jgi:UDP-N-acetylmuramate--L-alanine ligase/UDP-N-acetylenolpyruvoylglucosamine reductase